MFTFTTRGLYHTGMVFCRRVCWQQSGPVRVHCFFLRFVYVRHATGLVKEGTRLLHWLTVVFIAAFSINLMLMWPVRCKQHLEYINTISYPLPTLSRYIWRGNFYLDSVKGKLCARSSLAALSNTDQSQLEFSLKPKLLLIAHTSVFWGLMHFYFFSAIKNR